MLPKITKSLFSKYSVGEGISKANGLHCRAHLDLDPSTPWWVRPLESKDMESPYEQD